MMIVQIEALNYRCLRYIQAPLSSFHILVGPNASGKTTFLDVIAFLGKLVRDGLDAAIEERTSNFEDLTWNRIGRKFELAIVAEIPEKKRLKLENQDSKFIRYEVAIGLADGTNEVSIIHERVLFLEEIPKRENPQSLLFPHDYLVPDTLITPLGRGRLSVITKGKKGKDNFYDETGKKWDHSFILGPRKSALANLPEDESKFPVSIWLKKFLIEGVQQLILNSQLIRKASRPGQTRGFQTDGSNIPWVIDDLRKKNENHFKSWVKHLQTALPDIEDIKTIERADDKHRYLVIRYRNGLEVPSWMASDGTLRLLTLTLLAYLPDLEGIYLIEEPENGIHPRAIETMYQSLSSVYRAQVLLATHSPIILRVSEIDKLLCFAKTELGATDVVPGTMHPRLKQWKGKADLGDLFVSGVLS